MSNATEIKAGFSVGDRVSFYQVGTGRFGAGGGWRFGRIIGLHSDTIGINPSGLEMATVRFPELNREHPACDWALPLFRLVRETK
jgi:hypothetical protein